ncbi:uncharacterized protein LOC6561381 isoform X2 [Drosophila grimshawi]|uniref:uncharacterized protein LOC6561381 isoform X2 n=1 Tax=Drosophila grimshawi TaxID=7222 RepID=UPI000C86FDF8|nr:uncharacterized protein LOC6561381 isoform X2 [Drosophila grimshawi]
MDSIQHKRVAIGAKLASSTVRAMPWMASMLAALALSLLCDVSGISGGNRFVSYEELNAAPLIARSLPKRCSRFLGECPDHAAVPVAVQPEAIDIDADLNQSTSKMLNALFGLTHSTPATVHQTETALPPYQLPPMYYNDFYEDLLTSKRNNAHSAACDCKVMNDLIDLGSTYFPRYLMSAVCESRQDAKCSQGANCKPLEYKVKVLTLGPKPGVWLPEEVTQPSQWNFKTVTVTAGCFCTN